VSISDRIRDARTSLKLTQLGFAIQLGVDPQTVSRWERGEATPRLQHLRAIAELAEIPVADFFEDEVPA
jgi:transcriptional regulator with XRE-family HTH domain